MLFYVSVLNILVWNLFLSVNISLFLKTFQFSFENDHEFESISFCSMKPSSTFLFFALKITDIIEKFAIYSNFQDKIIQITLWNGIVSVLWKWIKKKPSLL